MQTHCAYMIVIEKQKGGQAGYKHLLVVTEALRHLVSCLSTMLLLLELYMWQCAVHCSAVHTVQLCKQRIVYMSLKRHLWLNAFWATLQLCIDLE